MEIQKIRNLTQAITDGRIRELTMYDGPNDAILTRFCWLARGLQISVCQKVRCAINPVYQEKNAIARWKTRKAINKWIAKHGVKTDEMVAPPPIHGWRNATIGWGER